MAKSLKIYGVLIIIGILVLILIFKFVINKQHPDYNSMTPEVETSASALFNNYTGNKQEADILYTGKLIQINGIPSNIETLDSTIIVNFVFSEGMFGDEGVRCIFNSINKTPTVKDNLKITLKGYCVGYNDTDVILEKCSIINK